MDQTASSLLRRRAVIGSLIASLLVLAVRPPIAIAIALAAAGVMLVVELAQHNRHHDEELMVCREEIADLRAAMDRQHVALAVARRRRHPSFQVSDN